MPKLFQTLVEKHVFLKQHPNRLLSSHSLEVNNSDILKILHLRENALCLLWQTDLAEVDLYCDNSQGM
jgi:hypothetical protein